MSLNVSALADFNNQIAGELVLKMVYGGSTIEYVTVLNSKSQSICLRLVCI